MPDMRNSSFRIDDEPADGASRRKRMCEVHTYRSYSHTRTGSALALAPVSLGYVLEMSPHGWRFVPEETMRIDTARDGAEWWGASGVFARGYIRILVPEPLPNDHLPRKLGHSVNSSLRINSFDQTHRLRTDRRNGRDRHVFARFKYQNMY
ncbi:hypothetical protein B0H14DRAFT_3767958 [Mycena olivaceomarginata]|nr:hypothetical protein B0H14DRAFT_3767958 [Mycena olivaceomarginata]